jgi:hypothetical protein
LKWLANGVIGLANGVIDVISSGATDGMYGPPTPLPHIPKIPYSSEIFRGDVGKAAELGASIGVGGVIGAGSGAPIVVDLTEARGFAAQNAVLDELGLTWDSNLYRGQNGAYVSNGAVPFNSRSYGVMRDRLNMFPDRQKTATEIFGRPLNPPVTDAVSTRGIPTLNMSSEAGLASDYAFGVRSTGKPSSLFRTKVRDVLNRGHHILPDVDRVSPNGRGGVFVVRGAGAPSTLPVTVLHH